MKGSMFLFVLFVSLSRLVTKRDKETNKTNKNIEPFLWRWRAMSDLHHTRQLAH